MSGIPFLIIAIVILYVLPSIIAYVRKHNNISPIILINIVFGWTLLGWFLALVWCLTDNVEESDGTN